MTATPTSNPRGATARTRIRELLSYRESGVFLALVIFFVVMYTVSPIFRSPFNLTTILRQISVTSIMAMGQTLVIVSGSFDLSQASIARPGRHGNRQAVEDLWSLAPLRHSRRPGGRHPVWFSQRYAGSPFSPAPNRYDACHRRRLSRRQLLHHARRVDRWSARRPGFSGPGANLWHPGAGHPDVHRRHPHAHHADAHALRAARANDRRQSQGQPGHGHERRAHSASVFSPSAAFSQRWVELYCWAG